MAVGLHRKFFQKIPFEIEEIILFAIILLNVFDAIEVLPSGLDYVKKIISWSALGLLLYKAKIIKLFTGVDRPWLDGILIGGYFLLIIKNLVAYATGSVQTNSAFLQPLYIFLFNNSGIIERTGMIIGLCLLIFVAVHLTLRAKIKAPCVLAILKEADTEIDSTKKAVRRFGKAIFVIFMFFVVIFNLVMEWLAIAIDAPLLMIGLATYLFFIIKHKKRFLPESFLAKFGDFGGKFYEDVIEHFKYKHTILRALSGLLVLHLLTDALNFMWPFIFSVADPLYYSLFSSAHPFLIGLLQTNFLQVGLLQGLVALSIYIANIIGLLALLLLPGLLWILLYKNKPLILKRRIIALLLGTFTIMIINPVFLIRPLFGEVLFGVDIIGRSVLQTGLLIPLVVLIVGLLVGLFVYVVSKEVYYEKKFVKLIVVIVQFFFAAYSVMFFFSITTYYTSIIPFAFASNRWLLGFMLVILFACTVIFYVLSLISFLFDTHLHAQKHLRYKPLRSKKHS